MADAFLDAVQIRAATFVRHVEIHDTLGSTNDRAAGLAPEASIELPALVVARHQTAGRGRGQHKWWSAEGALTFSLLLDSASTGVVPANWPQLSLATAVAVCDALRRIAPHAVVGIKWPNDVMLDGGKVCGILIESPSGSAPAKDRVIVGVGINVGNSWRSAPREAGPNGTAMCDATGREHELQAVLCDVLRALAERFIQLRNRNPQLIRAWQQLDLISGENVILEFDGQSIEGRCIEIAHDGAILLETAYERQRFYSGSVRNA